jgi:hypothetical protein
MSTSTTNKDFLLDVLRRIPSCHIALFLRLPIKVVDDGMRREEAILAIINETTDSNYQANVWPIIMSISRIPELVDQLLISDEKTRLALAVQKLQCRFELQPWRFLIYQLLPSTKTCFICHSHLGEPKFDEICDIITRSNVHPCAMYKNECCDFVYKYGHARNRRTRVRLVVPDAIFNQEFIHLFDHLIYERSMLVSFSNLVCQAASNFQSYTHAVSADIDENRHRNNESPMKNKLHSKLLSVVIFHAASLKKRH